MNRSVLLSLVSLLVFVLLAEAAVRIVDPDLTVPGNRPRFRHDPRFKKETLTHARDDVLGWRLKPNVSEPTMRTNSRGFRGPEFSLEKPNNVFRIVFVGDSNVMGFGVASSDSMYSSVVQRCLTERATGRQIEVINMGVDAYSSHQVRLLLKLYLPQITPDVVCVQVGFNDFLHSSVPDREFKFKRPSFLKALELSHAYRWFRRTVLRFTGAARRNYSPARRVLPSEFESNIRDIVARCRRVGTTPILISTWPRPYIPFAVNEVLVDEDGRNEWITQRRWVLRKLEQGGVDPPLNQRHPDFLRIVEAACREQPTWCIPQFLRSQGLYAAGRYEDSERALAEAMRLETDRAVFQAYMRRLGRVAVEEDVEVFDVEAQLKPLLSGMTKVDVMGLFSDFVHLRAPGQVLVGAALCDVIETIIVDPPSQ